MKLSIVMMAAAAVYAAPADDQQAALAPDGDREMQALLSMDSFNITSADPEQNRLHAVCDMEYRLSKMTRSASAPGLMNLAQANTNAASLFNPFTLPLMAVKQHIALLQQEEKFLQAQSDAFSGSSSSASTTAAPSAVTLSGCGFIANTGTDLFARKAINTRAATDSVVVDIQTNGKLEANQQMRITIDAGQAKGTEKWLPITTDITATVPGDAKRLMIKTGGTDAMPTKADGNAVANTDIAFIVAAGTACTSPCKGMSPAGADTTDGVFVDAVTGAVDVKVGNGGLRQDYTFPSGLQQLSAADKTVMILGPMTDHKDTTNTKPYTITVEIVKGTATTATVVGKATCTTTV